MTDEETLPKEFRLKNYFGPHLSLMRWMGVPIIPVDDFSDTGKTVYYAYCFLFLFVFPYAFCLTEGMNVFFDDFGDIDKMTFTLSYLTTHAIGVCKITLLIYSRNDLWNYCQTLENGLFRPDLKRGGLKEFKIIKEAIKNVNFQATIFHIFVFLVISNRFLYAAFDKGYKEEQYDEITNTTITKEIRTLPFLSWFPFDRNVSPYYEIAFGYQIMATTIFGYYIGTADALITGFMIHIKAQFAILQNTLSIYVERAEEMLKEEQPVESINEENIQKRIDSAKIRLPEGVETIKQLPEPVMKHARTLINNCYLHHEQILILCEKCEEEYNLLMLIQFLGSLALLCFQLFQLSLSNPKTFRFMSMTCYWILMMFQLLLYCWNGNEVQLISNSVSDSVYHSNWIVADQPTKKAMLLIMMRAQRPYMLTAGKFAFLSVSTYTSILRGSASYFMVLRQMNYS